MSKIGNAFKNGKAFIGFLTAGDPSLDKTYEYIMTMEKMPEPTSSKSVFLFTDPYRRRHRHPGSGPAGLESRDAH